MQEQITKEQIRKRVVRSGNGGAVWVPKDWLGEEIIVTRILRSLEKQFKVKIQVHFFTWSSFSAKSKLVEEIKNDGIILLG